MGYFHLGAQFLAAPGAGEIIPPQLLLNATGYEPQPGQAFKRTQVYAKALPERRKGGSTTPFPMT
jgi:hypothetical protein